jgi:hypothetical protein
MKYRATCTIIFNFESNLPYEKSMELAKKYLEEIPIKEGVEDIRTIFSLDKMKEKVEKINLGEFLFEEVMPYITHDPIKREYKNNNDIYQVKMNTDRYHVFRDNIACVSCGLKATKILLECHPSDMVPHFNFYGEEDKKMILFTKDHIKAKAFGGEDQLDNYQTMCCICNNLKAHSNLTLESVCKLRKLYNNNKRKLGKKKLHDLIEKERSRIEQPWPHLIIKSTYKPNNAVQCLVDLVIIEKDGNLVCIHAQNLKETLISKGFIEKGTYLEEILEINDDVACNLPNGKTILIYKGDVVK